MNSAGTFLPVTREMRSVIEGAWVPGPGAEFFSAVEQALADGQQATEIHAAKAGPRGVVHQHPLVLAHRGRQRVRRRL